MTEESGNAAGQSGGGVEGDRWAMTEKTKVCGNQKHGCVVEPFGKNGWILLTYDYKYQREITKRKPIKKWNEVGR